jgi:hypothetical protein
MKRLRLGFVVAVLLGSAPVVMALEKPLFEVCVNPATDATFSNDFAKGSVITGVGFIVPVGTIEAGNTSSDCSNISDIAARQIGTFFVRGNIVLGLPAPPAAPDDLAYVSWQFRVDNQGSIETSGPVKTTSPYFQTIVGATGDFHQFRDRIIRTDVLDTDAEPPPSGFGPGFQFRLTAVNE